MSSHLHDGADGDAAHCTALYVLRWIGNGLWRLFAILGMHKVILGVNMLY